MSAVEFVERKSPLADFLKDRCVIGMGLWVRALNLDIAYWAWCAETSVADSKQLSREEVREWLATEGISQSRSRRDSLGRQMRTFEVIGLSGVEVKPK